MIKEIQTSSGKVIHTIDGDTHAGKWCEEQRRLDYDRSVEDVIRKINPGDVVIDAGANIGAYTVRMAEKVGGAGFVIAFEPMRETFECLSHNCAEYNHIFVFNKALSNRNDMVSMEANQNVGMCHVSTIGGSMVETITIDSLGLSKCDFIKMDIEGYEPLALQGAMETIKKFRPKIFIELNDGALARYGFKKNDILIPLLEIGYNMELIDPSHNLNMPQLDIFLMP